MADFDFDSAVTFFIFTAKVAAFEFEEKFDYFWAFGFVSKSLLFSKLNLLIFYTLFRPKALYRLLFQPHFVLESWKHW